MKFAGAAFAFLLTGSSALAFAPPSALRAPSSRSVALSSSSHAAADRRGSRRRNGATAFFRSPERANGMGRDGALGMADATVDVEAEVVPEVPEGETFEFKAEVGRVMDIIINSLYSNRDVFLRELVSNAADACDKKRFLSITASSESDASAVEKPTIKIKSDKEAMTVTIEDSGVGMTKEELQNNLGKIAQSGTKKFLEALGEGNTDVNLIGQFGVGFYSAYLVAEKVDVVTKSMQEGSTQLRWSSEASNSYTIAEDNSEPIEGSGTRLVLHLKDDALDYLEPSKLEELLKQYSEFVEFPISVWKEKTDYVQEPDEEANKDLEEGEEPKMKTVPKTSEGYEPQNTNKPIWLRPPSDVTKEEYKDFYQSAFRASYDEPMANSHFSLEGQIECKAILYIPGMLPMDLSRDMFDENSRNIRLYVKRVFINDQFDDILPRWLKFVRGVVDSQDLPLNVSREILQKSKVLSIINKRLVRKSLDMIREIEEDEDESKYIMFWNNFGKYLRVGVIEDQRNKDDIIPLLRFFSSKNDEEYTSLAQYVEGMKEGQKTIYYVTADGKDKAKMSPAAEKMTSRGYEVLYMTEPLDEIMIESVSEYKEFKLVDVSKEGLNLDDEDKEAREKKEEELNDSFAMVKDYLETALEGKVSKVKMTDMLSESPAALVQSAYGMSPTMQRYMKAQNVASGGSEAGMMGSFNQAVLEVNPSHPIVQDLERMVKSGEDVDETANFAVLLYDVAALTSGYEIEDSGDFAQRVMKMMSTKATDDVQDAVITPEVMAEPATPEAVAEPVTPEIVAEIVTPEGVTEPVMPEAVVEPATPEIVVEPVTPEAVAEPVTPEAVAEPVAPEVTVEPKADDKTSDDA